MATRQGFLSIVGVTRPSSRDLLLARPEARATYARHSRRVSVTHTLYTWCN